MNEWKHAEKDQEKYGFFDRKEQHSKIPVERRIFRFVTTNSRSVQEFGRHPKAKASSANENNAVKKLQ
jgi:hypothetical protein